MPHRGPALLLLCALAAGADDGPRPTATPTASPTASGTVSPTASGTVPPASVTPGRTASPPAPTATTSRTATPSASPTFTPPTSPTATGTPTETVTATPTAVVIPALELLAIHADAEWIRDAQGRVVLLRGANYSGLEFGNFIGNRNGPEAADFAQMASWGFNVIRLPIAWSYLEPAPNQLDESHLVEQVDRVIDFADQHGIAVVLEMHQFLWGRCIPSGNGAPAWACEGRGYTAALFDLIRASCEFLNGTTGPDGRPLLDHFADVWRLLGRHYAGDRRVAGFDFFNEPHTVACPGGSTQETQLLYDYYRRLRAIVRGEGATQTFFFDPPVSRNIGFPVFAEPFGPDVVYAPHLYTQTGGAPEIQYDGTAADITADYEQATGEAAGFGGPLFAGEFGGNTDLADGFRAATEAFLRDSLAEQDRRLIGGAAWAYFPSDNTFSVVDAEGVEKGELVNILARPYARRIAGIPTAMRFDLASREFVFSWRVEPGQASDVSEVFVPARHFPELAVEASAGVVFVHDPDAQLLRLRAGAPGEYTIHLR